MSLLFGLFILLGVQHSFAVDVDDMLDANESQYIGLGLDAARVPAVDPNDTTCPIYYEFPTEFSSLISKLYSECEDRVTDALKIKDYKSRLDKFSVSVCPCFRENEGNLWSVASTSLGGNKPSDQAARNALRGDPVPDQEQINKNIERANTYLEELRNGIMFQASVLSADPQVVQGLSSAYSNGFYSSMAGLIQAKNQDLKKDLERKGRTIDGKGLHVPEYDSEILTGKVEGPSCVSMREYRAYRQFPEDPKFYQDLLDPRHQEYKENEWHFTKLQDQLRRECENKRILNLSDAKADPKTSWIVRRIEFLQRNPLLKNMLESRAGREKKDLFNVIMQNFKPTNPSCVVSEQTQACQMQAVTRAQNYRDGLMQIFKNEDIARDVAKQSKDQLEDYLRGVSRKVASGRKLPSPGQLEAFQKRPGEEQLSQMFNMNFTQQRIQDINRMCPLIQESSKLRGNYVVHELEAELLKDLEQPKYDQKNRMYMNNLGFEKFSNFVCNRRTYDVNQPPVVYADFIREQCTPASKCPNPVMKFLASTKSVDGEGTIDIAEVFARYQVVAPIGNIDQKASDQIANRSGLSYNEHVSSISRNLTSAFSGSSGGGVISNVNIPVSVNSSRSNAVSSAANNIGNQSSMIPIITPNVQTPEATPSETPKSALKRELRQGEMEYQGIRDQISGLRDVLRRENSSGSPNGSLMDDLTRRLSSLERRLSEKDRENEGLRRQIATFEEVSPAKAPEGSAAPVPRFDDRRANSSIAAVAQSVPVSALPQAPSTPALNIPAPGSRVSSSVPVRSSSVAAGNSALLSKYNVRSAGEQLGIIVATPSTEIDYSQLRIDSAASVLPLRLSPDEFSKIQANDQSVLNRYLDQVKAVPGEVVRLSITSGDKSLELFVLKNGDQIAFVPQGSMLERAPASVIPSREFTLQGLQNELGN